MTLIYSQRLQNFNTISWFRPNQLGKIPKDAPLHPALSSFVKTHANCEGDQIELPASLRKKFGVRLMMSNKFEPNKFYAGRKLDNF